MSKPRFNLKLIISKNDGYAQDELINFNVPKKQLKNLKQLTDIAFEHVDEVFNHQPLPLRDILGRFTNPKKDNQ